MVKPPEAEPVSAASTLIATTSETSGPPSIASTQSRTAAKAGSAAMTAPKPTRLATLIAGSPDAFAPASMLWRSAGRRARLKSTTVAIAAAIATTTDHTPATALIDVPPQRSSARYEESICGRTTSDIERLTAMTTTSGNAAIRTGGSDVPWLAGRSSPGTKYRAVVRT